MSLQQLITKEYYETFAGSDWPSYEKFVNGEYDVRGEIYSEIESFKANTIKERTKNNLKNWYQTEEIILPLKFFMFYALPGIIGLIGFFYLGGTFEKFLITTISCIYIHQFYQHTVHKWLTHRMFEPKWWIRPIMLWSITLHDHVKIIQWVVIHKLHHRYSDSDMDPMLASIGVYKTTMSLCRTPKFTHTEFNSDVDKHLPWKDVQFVNKYQNFIYWSNFIILCAIDLQIGLLSLFASRLYTQFYPAISNYIIHGSGKDVATNLAWYWEFCFFGECLHKAHHDRPSKLDLSSHGRIEPSAKIWKYFAKSIRS